ncbi:MAG: class II aldolase/adducin family protein [Oligoflexia bacterium]|nr:class II aldolase/adducin family protein [Oligoflexia bacterium]
MNKTIMTIEELKKQIVDVAKLMYKNGYIAANDGNVSVLLDDGTIVTTPSGVSKGMLTPEALVIINKNGEKISGGTSLNSKPSSEIKMHLKVYELRSDIKAVVHAHPPITTAFSVANIRLSDCILPETIFTLGNIKITEYATPTTEAVPKSIEKSIIDNDVIILTRHGSLTVGDSLMDAYLKLESLEHTAKIISESMKLSLASSSVTPLPPQEIERLKGIRNALLESKQRKKSSANELNDSTELTEEMVNQLVYEVLKRLEN